MNDWSQTCCVATAPCFDFWCDRTFITRRHLWHGARNRRPLPTSATAPRFPHAEGMNWINFRFHSLLHIPWNVPRPQRPRRALQHPLGRLRTSFAVCVLPLCVSSVLAERRALSKARQHGVGLARPAPFLVEGNWTAKPARGMKRER